MKSARSVSISSMPWYYIGFVSLVILGWLYYMANPQLPEFMRQQLPVVVTMIFGSFVAGSSPEGSAAIAYPIFTLFLDIDPGTTRNFAFAIQSLGMTAASIFILNKKIAVDKKYIFYVALSGLPGLVFGTYFIVPLISPALAKLCFVSLWFGFGLVLWKLNQSSDEDRPNVLPLMNRGDIGLLIFSGFLGGIISAVFGTGINILSYCMVVSYYKLNEKVATPSSVLIMTIETIAGFFLHYAILTDFNAESRQMWLACIPFVVLFAPIGAWLVSRVPRFYVATYLSVILMVQFVGAIYVIRPDPILASISLCLIAGAWFFFNWVTRKGSLRFGFKA